VFCIFGKVFYIYVLKIVLLGAGNVATHLGQAWVEAGYDVAQVYSRTPESAAYLGEKLHCHYTHLPQKVSLDADVYVFSLKDNSYKDVLDKLNWKSKLLLHTSGSLDLDILEAYSTHIGVIYPLQTFTKEKSVDLGHTPFLLEAKHDTDLKIIRQLASAISDNILNISSQQRAILHVAAVISCNFVNFMYSSAEKILLDNNLNFNLLRPLIFETAQKVMSESPSLVQTGPARRGDTTVIQNHLNLLQKYPELQQLYEDLSQQIVVSFQQENIPNNDKL